MIEQYIKDKNLEGKLLAGLYLIATPIGNINDISIRALSVIKRTDYIYCENPLQTRKLLNYFAIKKKLLTYNDHSNENTRNNIANIIRLGATVALLSDAGTPTISDPGYKLISQLSAQKLNIYPIPGACAAITALSCSGLATDSFHFFGFPPRKTVELTKYLNNIISYQGSLVFYETAKRIENFIITAQKAFPDSKAFVARELTKLYEEKISGDLGQIKEHLASKTSLKGEFVVIIENKNQQEQILFKDNLAEIISLGRNYLPASKLSKFLSEVTNLNKNQIYKKILED
jgi:16S rRNA (cytidine1402-2'-O)-methyltransferase